MPFTRTGRSRLRFHAFSLRSSNMLCDLMRSSDPFDTLSESIFFFGALFWSPRPGRPELAPSLFFSKTDDGDCAGRGPPLHLFRVQEADHHLHFVQN